MEIELLSLSHSVWIKFLMVIRTIKIIIKIEKTLKINHEIIKVEKCGE